MSEPRQTCEFCGDVEICRPSDRAFPPDAAKKRLAKRCEAKGHISQPKYCAGISATLLRILGESR
jgi:hypothetical protein